MRSVDTKGYRDGEGIALPRMGDDGFEPATFARDFQQFVAGINRLVPPRPSPVRDLLAEHLGCDPGELPVLSEPLESAEHPNLQLALDELTSGSGWHVVGLSLGLRQFGAFSLGALAADRMADWGHPSPRPMPVEYISVPVGPDETLDCAQLALFLGTWHGVRTALMVMAGDERSHLREQLTVEVLAPDRDIAGELLAELRRRRQALNVYRGKTLSFGFTQHGNFRLEFLRIPHVDRSQVVLPDADLDAIEAHTVGIADQVDALRAAGRHIKRGLLLYGPPGTGKTWSVAYLRSRMPDRTTIVLNGDPGMERTLGQAVAVARSLQPAMVVLEDVDLIAHERSRPGWETNPLLFQLLNEMDGLGEDADVVFVLTTNRLELLEPALATRPGRIDQAVEITLPDAECRRRLFELYMRGIPGLDPVIDLAPLVAATGGVSAAFVKELVRRAVMLAAGEASDGEALTVGARHLSNALAALDASRAPVLRTLLGAGEGD
jgi:cell division protease FtsH